MEHFSTLEDPRRYNKRPLLLDIVVMSICAVICGADDGVAVAEFGEAKEDWFKEYLELPHGIPSPDTFRRVFAVLDAAPFRNCFISWIRAVYEVTESQVVPIDGKKLRRSPDQAIGKDAIHMVSAWASPNHLGLGQVKVNEKSNEITAIPKLLDMLELSGGIVTIDAMGCQKAITEKVKDKNADYTIAAKANQKGLLEDVTTLFDDARESEVADYDYYKTAEKSHGRFEVRECWTISDADLLKQIRNLADWKGLRTIAMVRRARRIGTKVEIEVKYYISSLPSGAQHILSTIRGHWGIENQAHWVLDIAFREDDSRLRKGNGAQNFAVLRHIALNLLK